MTTLLPPSSAARRMLCPGSRAMEARVPPRELTEDERDGIKAHELAARCLRNPKGPHEDPGAEMSAAIDTYVGHVFKIAGQNANLCIEGKITINENSEGIFDCYHMNPYTRTFYIWEFKYGHSSVEAFENWQLIAYVSGICKDLFDKVDENYPEENLEKLPITKFVLVVVQPRCYADTPIKIWEVSPVEMHAYIERLQKSEERALRIDAPCTPNPLCKTCSARNVCPALQQAALANAELATESTADAALTPEQLGNELRILHHAADLINSRITGLEEEALHLLKQGQRVPHYGIGFTKPRERWTIPVGEIIQLGRTYGVEILKPAEPITPNQAIKAGLPDDVVRSFTEFPTGSAKLVADNNVKTRKMFGGTK